ncbi:putative membrane protein YesL [Sphingobacterium sp. HSC-15S19]
MKIRFVLVLILVFVVCFLIAASVYYFLDDKSSVRDSIFVGFISSSVVITLSANFNKGAGRI